jgi:dUTP pyrophosphatase
MLIPGRSLIPKIISNVRCAKIQAQPCGVDLTLKQIKTWSSSGRIDFDNSLRASASTERVPFFRRHDQSQGPISRSQQVIVNDPVGLEGPMDPRHESVMLETGSYLVEFNEIVNVPLNLMGQIFVRSSLFRSGALLSAGVMDSGYQGAVGAMLQVVNPHGLILFRDARLAQIVFHEMKEPVEGYSGTYQGSRSI